MLVSPSAFLSRLDGYKTLLLPSHHNPDGDCVFTSLALEALFIGLGKEVVLLSPGAFTGSLLLPYRERFSAEVRQHYLTDPHTAVVMVDCHDLSRTGFDVLSALPLFAVDHHELSPQEKEGPVCLDVDTLCPASTLMAQGLIEASGRAVTPEEAEHIFLGFSTDTGFFRFLTEKSGPYLSYVTRLLEAGVSPKAMSEQLSRGWEFEGRQIVGSLLQRAQRFLDGKLVVTYGLPDDYKAGFDRGVVNALLLNTEGVQVVITVKPTRSDDECKLSCRSRGGFDLLPFVRSVDNEGGGHENAAGATLQGTLSETLKRLPSLIAPFFD